MKLIPAIYFAGFGLVLFIGSFTNAGFRWDATIVASCLLIPLLFRHRIVHMVTGLLASVIWGYFVLASVFIWIIGYEEGIYMRTWGFALATVVAFWSFACSLALLYVGTRPQPKPTAAAAI